MGRFAGLVFAGFTAGLAVVPAYAERLLVHGAIAEPADTSGFGDFTSFEVRLVDVTDPAAPPRLVGGTKLTPGRDHPWPLPFRIAVESEDLAAGNAYALEARIVANRVLFETAEPVPADPFAADAVTDVTLAVPASDALADTRWVAEEAGPGGAPAKVRFARGRLVLMVGCKMIEARTAFSGAWVSLTRVEVSGGDCRPEVTAFEESVAKQVTNAQRFALEDGGLVLQAADGSPLIRLRAE